MKKLRRTLLAVLLATLLIGCTEQISPTEPKNPKQDAPVLQEMEPIRKPEIAMTEGTIPARETESTKPTSKPATTEPRETEPATKPENSTPIKSEEPIEKPQTTAPRETVPVETEPTPTEPKVTESPETETTVPPTTEEPEAEPTEPPVTEPPTTVPPVTEPEPTEPTSTETVPEETVPTEPTAEAIDTSALESYGRSYASSAYGYNGTSVCHPGSGAGYFPAATKEITTMEDGYWYVQQAIDSQYYRDIAYGYSPYEEIDGVIVRCPINVSVDSAGGNTYTITVYYGGTA